MDTHSTRSSIDCLKKRASMLGSRSFALLSTAKSVAAPEFHPAFTFACSWWATSRGIQSQRGIAWRCADGLSIRQFLGLKLTDHSPDHSSLTVIRERLPDTMHESVFEWVLRLANEKKLLGRNWSKTSWQERKAVLANRRRAKGTRGRKLQRMRSEKVERTFAHVLETGGGRRCRLRGTEKIQKRYFLMTAAYNLGVVMRMLFGSSHGQVPPFSATHSGNSPASPRHQNF